MVTMENKQSKPQFSKAHLTAMNLNNFKMIEAMGLKIIASRSTWMALPPYQKSWKSTKRIKSDGGHGQTDTQTDRQTGELINLLYFLKSSLKSILHF
jgi:hypothetical protein